MTKRPGGFIQDGGGTTMPQGKPNILVIWGDDIGITNLSCYSDGLMGYRTPNIDRIGSEGVRFTDCYGEQSCTAGRSSLITGLSPGRASSARSEEHTSGLQSRQYLVCRLLLEK